jgi:hypothetical protein
VSLVCSRFPRRSGVATRTSTSSSREVAPRPESSVVAGDALGSSRIDGVEAQVASVRLRPSDSIKVDPSCIVSVPLGVEVRPIYGAPQLIQQQAAQQSGGLFARLRESAPPAPTEPTAPILAEIVLQPGHAMPADSVQLAPVTVSKLHTIQLAEYGQELYIARGAFLASAVTVKSVDEQSQTDVR